MAPGTAGDEAGAGGQAGPQGQVGSERAGGRAACPWASVQMVRASPHPPTGLPLFGAAPLSSG